MIQPGSESERHALPRWSGIQTAKKLGELASAKLPTVEQQNIGKGSLQELLLQWETEKNLPLLNLQRMLHLLLKVILLC